LKLFQEWEEGRIKGNDGGVNSAMIYCKNFCKCHSVPQYNNNKIIIILLQGFDVDI
jgi:hypothetical protein